MSLQASLVIPEDAVLIPVEDVAEEQRKGLEWKPGDYAISRPNTRTTAKLLDPDSAALLEEFRRPARVAEAVFRFSARRQLDATKVLDEAFPLLQRLVAERLLVDADGDDIQGAQPLRQLGAEVAGVRVTQVLQVLPDTELYQAKDRDGRLCVLKIQRESSGNAVANLDREGAVLRTLGGDVAPELFHDGEFEGQRYLCMEWCPGHDVATAATALRERVAGDRERRLLALAVTLTRAYADLHARGVIHGDVHPRNVFVDHTGRVRILDFGLARDTSHDEGRPVPRGGVGYFFESEFARAQVDGTPSPPVTEAGEQYSLAVLLDQLFAGAWYLDFSLEKAESFRQIAEDPPLTFEQRGTSPWLEVEVVLRRALDKDPARRFASMTELADALAAIPVPPVASPTELATLLTPLVKALHPDGDLYRSGVQEAPTGSIANGAAGLAYALYRIACQRDDPALLAQADLWSTRAVAEAAPEAFAVEELDRMFEREGHTSPFHCWPGVFCVQARVSAAMGDALGVSEAVDAFAMKVQEGTGSLDLLFGRPGVLHGYTELLPAIEKHDVLREMAAPVYASILAEVESLPPIREAHQLPLLGMAHGWAGVLWAVLRWCRLSDQQVPPTIQERLDQLAELAEHSGNGLRWRRRQVGHDDGNMADYLSGWCNGSAGLTLLWVEALRHDGTARHERLAVGAARHALDDASSFADLCCGLVGRAYALLILHQVTGDRHWLDEARFLAERSHRHLPSNATREHGLLKGPEGLACLLADLERPEFASFPWFETL